MIRLTDPRTDATWKETSPPMHGQVGETATQPLLLGRGGSIGGRLVLGLMEGVDTRGGVGGRGGAGAVGGLVDVLAVDVDGVGDEGGAAVATAGVALLEAEELELLLNRRLEAVEESTRCHCDCRLLWLAVGSVRGWDARI